MPTMTITPTPIQRGGTCIMMRADRKPDDQDDKAHHVEPEGHANLRGGKLHVRRQPPLT